MFYVYELAAKTSGKVFYVGKGSGDRIKFHREVLTHPSRKDYNRGVYRRMRDILKGDDFIERKVFETQDETAALLHEQKLIQHYGFDNLVNTQSHAFTGRKLKPEVGRIIAEKLRGKTLPTSVKQKIRRSLEGKPKTSEHNAAVSTAKKGKQFSDAHRKALSEAAKNRPVDRKKIEAMCLANTGSHRDNSKALAARKLKYGY